jgi:hypothetical protein
VSAADLIPDLSGAGFRLEMSGRAPALNPGQDSFIAIFTGTNPGVSGVRIEVNLHPTVEAARAQFGPLAEALRNPPPELFGPGTSQVDGAPVFKADEAKSYVTARPDGQGNLVFSDAYRMGRAVVIIFTLGNDAEAVAKVREDVARAMDKLAPR